MNQSFTNLTGEEQIKLFVGGIQPTCTEQDLKNSLSAYYEFISKIDIKMKNSYLNRGYAFIFVKNRSAAENMVKTKFRLGDRILQIQNINKNNKEKEEYKLKRLYLKNLPFNTSDIELYQCFLNYGQIRSSYIIKDRYGYNRDYGFIDFERVEDVDYCLDEFARRPLIIRGNRIKVRRFIKLDKELNSAERRGISSFPEDPYKDQWESEAERPSEAQISPSSSQIITNENHRKKMSPAESIAQNYELGIHGGYFTHSDKLKGLVAHKFIGSKSPNKKEQIYPAKNSSNGLKSTLLGNRDHGKIQSRSDLIIIERSPIQCFGYSKQEFAQSTLTDTEKKAYDRLSPSSHKLAKENHETISLNHSLPNIRLNVLKSTSSPSSVLKVYNRRITTNQVSS